MSLPLENNKVIKSVEIETPVGETNLLLTIENTPEDVFKRLSAFIATVEGTKGKLKKWAK